MNFDKNTVIGFVLIFLLLIGFNFFTQEEVQEEVNKELSVENNDTISKNNEEAQITIDSNLNNSESLNNGEISDSIQLLLNKAKTIEKKKEENNFYEIFQYHRHVMNI